MNFKGQNRRMFRKPGAAKRALGILASSQELANAVEPMRMADGGSTDAGYTQAEKNFLEFAYSYQPTKSGVDDLFAEMNGGKFEDPVKKLLMSSALMVEQGMPVTIQGTKISDGNAMRRKAAAAAGDSELGAPNPLRMSNGGSTEEEAARQRRAMMAGVSPSSLDDGNTPASPFVSMNSKPDVKGGSLLRNFMSASADDDVPADGLDPVDADDASTFTLGLKQDNTSVLGEEELSPLVTDILDRISGEDRQDGQLVLAEMGQDPALTEDPDFWQAVTIAGLGMASGTSNMTLKNLADGFLLGMQSYRQSRQERRKTEYERAIQSANLELNRRKVEATEASVLLDAFNPDSTGRERIALKNAKEYGVSFVAGDQIAQIKDTGDRDRAIVKALENSGRYYKTADELKQAQETSNFPFYVTIEGTGRGTATRKVYKKNPKYDPDAK